MRLPPFQRAWLREWLLLANPASPGADSSAGSCDAVGVPYVEAISPLPCRDTLPVLVTMWLSVLSGALILCCTSCVTAASAHSFNADQLWCAPTVSSHALRCTALTGVRTAVPYRENAVAEEVAKLMLEQPGPQSPGPDFSFYTPRGRSSAARATGSRLRGRHGSGSGSGDGAAAAGARA